MRLARIVIPIATLSLIVAGCGGSSVVVQEAPGGPAKLSVPGGGTQLGSAATPSGASDSGASTGTSAKTNSGSDSSGSDTSNTSGAASSGDASGGTASPDTQSAATPVPTVDSNGGASEAPTSTPVPSTPTTAPTPVPTPTAAGGGAAAPTATPPPAGADAQKFEAFCQQNPGAC